MGLFDKLKKNIQSAADALAPQQPQQPAYQQQQAPDEPDDHGDDDDDGGGGGGAQFDLAGFSPDDEDAFYEVRVHMESEGMYGGTDESRAHYMQQYGIRDREHWHTVKESMYALLARKFGSYDEVGQREMNFTQGRMQRHMQGQVAKQAAGGGFAPVEGVTLEAWASINAAIVSGAPAEDAIRGAGLDQARWDRVCGEWNARMARDTTAAVATVYGNAFQAASQGRYAAYAREAAAARAANRDLAMEAPLSMEQYWELLFSQGLAAKQGRDPIAALREQGLSVIDWTDIGTFMGYLMNRTAVRHWAEFEAIFKRVEAKYQAIAPGVDLDIKF